MNWNILILSLCLMLLVFLLWKEATRQDKRSLIARIAATVVAVLSMASIALPVMVKRTPVNANLSSAVVLTAGFDKDSITHFVKQNPGVKLFAVDKNIKDGNVQFLADLGLLSESPFNISTLHVFGHGLYEHEVKQAAALNIVFHAATIANRITSVDWQQKITSGEKLVVQGKFNNGNERPVKIVLGGFNTSLDSAVLSANRNSSFQLTTFPRHFDKAVYSITVLSGGDTIETNPIPVKVEIPRPLNILLLAASPDFDNKFLKNWLGEKEYGFASRTYISKNKYERHYVNISSLSLSRMTTSLLDKFDVVIADLAELNAMPSADISNLKSSVENKGLGLIVKATAIPRSAGFYLSSFPLVETRDSAQHTLKLNGRGLSFLSTLKVQQPVYIMNRSGAVPLLTDQHTRTLASIKIFGLGKVVVTTLPNSYAWWLAGNKDDYASYWTVLLNKAAKKIVTNHAWERSPLFPRKDLEMKVLFQSEVDSVPSLQVSSESIYPSQNPVLPYTWSGRYWPKKSGWHAVINNREPAAWMYVYGDLDWEGVAAAEKFRSTKKYAGDRKNVVEDKIERSVPVEIPKIYFLILFIISAGFLWFEKKYRSG